MTSGRERRFAADVACSASTAARTRWNGSGSCRRQRAAGSDWFESFRDRRGGRAVEAASASRSQAARRMGEIDPSSRLTSRTAPVMTMTLLYNAGHGPPNTTRALHPANGKLVTALRGTAPLRDSRQNSQEVPPTITGRGVLTICSTAYRPAPTSWSATAPDRDVSRRISARGRGPQGAVRNISRNPASDLPQGGTHLKVRESWFYIGGAFPPRVPT